MSDKALRSKIIRLAHQKPELREHLLPLITKSASKDPNVVFIGKVIEKLGYSIDPKYRMHGYYVGEFEGVSMKINISKRDREKPIYEIMVMNDETRIGKGEHLSLPTSDREIINLVFKLTKKLV